MPAPYPPEFSLRAVERTGERLKPISQIAKNLGLAEWCLRNWVNQADIDDGKKDGSDHGRAGRGGPTSP